MKNRLFLFLLPLILLSLTGFGPEVDRDHRDLKPSSLNWSKAKHVIDADVDFNGNNITELADPVNLQDAATKKYVDDNAYTHPNHTGEVTSTGDGATVVADNVIDEANLKLDTGPTNDYVLTADDTKTGGMKWAAAGGGTSDHAALTNLAWSLAGHTIDTDIDMVGNDLTNIGAAYITQQDDTNGLQVNGFDDQSAVYQKWWTNSSGANVYEQSGTVLNYSGITQVSQENGVALSRYTPVLFRDGVASQWGNSADFYAQYESGVDELTFYNADGFPDTAIFSLNASNQMVLEGNKIIELADGTADGEAVAVGQTLANAQFQFTQGTANAIVHDLNDTITQESVSLLRWVPVASRDATIDGTITDDAAAWIDNAITDMGSNTVFDGGGGTYRLGAGTTISVTSLTNITFKNCIFKMHSSPGVAFNWFDFLTCDNIKFENCTIDGNQYWFLDAWILTNNNNAYNNDQNSIPIWIDTCSRVVFDNCKFINFYCEPVYFRSCTDSGLINCLIDGESEFESNGGQHPVTKVAVPGADDLTTFIDITAAEAAPHTYRFWQELEIEIEFDSATTLKWRWVELPAADEVNYTAYLAANWSSWTTGVPIPLVGSPLSLQPATTADGGAVLKIYFDSATSRNIGDNWDIRWHGYRPTCPKFRVSGERNFVKDTKLDTTLSIAWAVGNQDDFIYSGNTATGSQGLLGGAFNSVIVTGNTATDIFETAIELGNGSDNETSIITDNFIKNAGWSAMSVSIESDSINVHNNTVLNWNTRSNTSLNYGALAFWSFFESVYNLDNTNVAGNVFIDQNLTNSTVGIGTSNSSNYSAATAGDDVQINNNTIVANTHKYDTILAPYVQEYVSGHKGDSLSASSYYLAGAGDITINQGAGNLGILPGALSSLTDAFDMVAIGENAFAAINDSVSRRSTALGESAGEYATTSIASIYGGRQAGRGAGGSFNSFYGAGTGWVQTPPITSTYDSYFGTSAAQDRIGDYNTVMGANALGSPTGNYTSNRSVIIGYNTAFERDVGDDKFWVDNSNTATPLLQGDFSTDDLIINGSLSSTGGFSSTTGTFSGAVSGTTGSFSSTVSADTNIFLKSGASTKGQLGFSSNDMTFADITNSTPVTLTNLINPSQSYFSAYRNANSAITSSQTTPTTMTFNSVYNTDSGYSLNTVTGVVTVSSAGVYDIGFAMSMADTGGTAGRVYSGVAINGTLTTLNIADGWAANGYVTMTLNPTPVSLSASDTVEVQTWVGAASNYQRYGLYCNLTITRRK